MVLEEARHCCANQKRWKGHGVFSRLAELVEQHISDQEGMDESILEPTDFRARHHVSPRVRVEGEAEPDNMSQVADAPGIDRL